jgi:hypothetical protein
VFDAEMQKCVLCFNSLTNKTKDDAYDELGNAVIVDPVPPTESVSNPVSIAKSSRATCRCRTAPPEYRVIALALQQPGTSPCPRVLRRSFAVCPTHYQYDPKNRECVLCRNDWPLSVDSAVPAPPPPSSCCLSQPVRLQMRVVTVVGQPCRRAVYTPTCPANTTMDLTTFSCAPASCAPAPPTRV